MASVYENLLSYSKVIRSDLDMTSFREDYREVFYNIPIKAVAMVGKLCTGEEFRKAEKRERTVRVALIKAISSLLPSCRGSSVNWYDLFVLLQQPECRSRSLAKVPISTVIEILQSYCIESPFYTRFPWRAWICMSCTVPFIYEHSRSDHWYPILLGLRFGPQSEFVVWDWRCGNCAWAI